MRSLFSHSKKSRSKLLLAVSCQFPALTQGGQRTNCRTVSMLLLGAQRPPGHRENSTQAGTQRALATRGGHEG